jgi:hypothetical protein
VAVVTLAALAFALAVEADAGDGQRRGRRAAAVGRDVATELFVEVPLDAPSSHVVFPFGGSHHAVPGVVAVNRPPYYCAPHTRGFRERADFIAHLRTRHGVEDRDVPAAVLVQRGQVRYLGD